MTYDLTNKVAIITGGSRGIGAAIAKRLAAEGATIAITYNDSADAAEDVVGTIRANGGKARAFQADAGDPAASASAVSRTVQSFGSLDIYVANAGIFAFGSIDELSYEDYRRQFAVNVDGVYAGSQAAAHKMNEGGRIIVISSVMSYSMPMPGGAAYGASKAAVGGLVRGWARDLGGRNILVNAIQAGPIDTDMNPADGPFSAAVTPMTAVGRYGEANEVAALAAFLASNESSYITGSTLNVDGGMAI